MHLFLYGPSGSGKSTIGKLLAALLCLPFIDLDSEIEQVIGQSISSYLEENGEASFRDLESAVFQKSVGGSDKVIALGGGCLLRDSNLDIAHAKGQVIFLDAQPSILFERLRGDSNLRPLLRGDLEASLASLLKERTDHYSSFQLRVDASELPDEVVWDIQKIIGRFHVRGMEPGYDVLLQENGLDSIGEILSRLGSGQKVLVVSDSNIAPLYLNQVMASLRSQGFIAGEITFQAGETSKTLETVSSIWNACLKAEIDRQGTIIALGGGVVNDLAGFCAATYMRGCDWITLPTSLLAMVDASIGGKTGFDLPQGKNLVGSFYPPCLVMADPKTLVTLPERELRAGLAEVIKHGVIGDLDLFRLCDQGWDAIENNLSEIVRRGMAVKIKVIEEDPFEHNSRAALNFGHTVGHAIELVSNYRILHGEAIAIGMVVETKLAERLSIAEPGLAEKLTSVISSLGLAVEIPKDLPRKELIKAMNLDKKKVNDIVRFSLPVSFGEIKTGIEVKNLDAILEEI
jgi:shikimate kinase/3-dehydroquinate synthase